jgi:nonsense-mediated mRNA decay protein 3
MAKRLKKLCALCGKHAENLVDGLCTDCYDKKFPKIKLEREKLSIKLCECGRAKIDKKWRDSVDEEELVKTVVERNVTPRHDTNIHVEYQWLKDRIIVRLLDADNSNILGSFVVNVKYEKCPRCAAYLGKYYEATLQIRGGEDFILDVLELVDDVLKKETSDEKAFVTEETRVRGGVDLKLGSKRVASKIVSLAKKYKNAEIKYSKKLKTRKAGKDIFRYTFLIKEVKHEKRKK